MLLQVTGQTQNLPTINDFSELEEIIKKDPNFIIKYLQDSLPSIISFGLKIIFCLILYFVGKKLIHLISKIVRRSLERSSVDKGVEQFLVSFMRTALYFLLFMIIAGNFGIEATSVIALVGSAGLAIGLAVQGTLANFAGGVLILLLKPFVVGDYIIEDVHKNEGTVKEIQLFYTVLRTVDNKTITIPNGALANTSLTNVTSQDKRRIDIQVGISYEADLKKAKAILDEMMRREQRIMEEEALDVFVAELADSAVILECRGWVKTEEYWKTKWDLTEQIKLLFDENGISIPYNQLDVTLTTKQV